MEKINLRGISESLSMNEMKMVKGGADTIKTRDADGSGGLSGGPCANSLPGSKCSVTWSAGTSSGYCVYDGNTKKVWCWTK